MPNGDSYTGLEDVVFEKLERLSLRCPASEPAFPKRRACPRGFMSLASQHSSLSPRSGRMSPSILIRRSKNTCALAPALSIDPVLAAGGGDVWWGGGDFDKMPLAPKSDGSSVSPLKALKAP